MTGFDPTGWMDLTGGKSLCSDGSLAGITNHRPRCRNNPSNIWVRCRLWEDARYPTLICRQSRLMCGRWARTEVTDCFLRGPRITMGRLQLSSARSNHYGTRPDNRRTAGC
jgi:hypothetical protein